MTQMLVTSRRPENLKRMLAPRSVAVVGASARSDKAGYQAVKAFERFDGHVWPINPQGGEILGRRVYKRLADIGEAPDLVILAVPSKACVQAFDEATDVGAGGAIIVSGGFAEAGEDGAALQLDLARTIARGATRLLGPNTSGFVNPRAGCTASFVPGLDAVGVGTVAVVAQSGGVNLTLAFLLQNRGAGVSLAVGLGNAVDVDTSDVIRYLADDPATRAIIVHLEGIGDGRRLFETIRTTTPKKPIVALIAGQTDVEAFAQSHTGRMLGSYARKKGMLVQAGAVVADSTDEAVDMAVALAAVRLAPHPDPGVALVTGQAGPALLIADALNKDGVRLAALGSATSETIKRLLPPLTYLGNPVDTGRPGATFPQIVDAVAADNDVQLTMTFAISEPAALDPASLVEVARHKSLLFGTIGLGSEISAIGGTLAANGIPSLYGPERLAKAAAALARDAVSQYRLSQQRRPASDAPAQPPVGGLDEAAAKRFLTGYGVRVPRSRICDTREAAQAFLDEIGGKVVVKILAADIAHKTDVGGVIVGVSSHDDMEAALDKIDRIPTVSPRRYLIEEMAPEGVELIVGAVRDPTFGPMVMVGMGGITAEILKDSSNRMAPLDIADALAMLDELRGRALLDGYRGLPRVDKGEIAAVLCALSQAVVEHPEIKEIEINPLRATGKGPIALDALVVA